MERLNPNRSLNPEHILFDCWAVCSLFARWRSGLRQKWKKDMMPTRKWKMIRNCLFNYE